MRQARHAGVRVAWKGFFVLWLLLGCARVSIDAKEPIKLDVTMRLDIYQHVSKDAAAIEDMIAAPAQKQAPMAITRIWGPGIAYAQEETGLPAKVQAAVERRRDRRPELLSYEEQGILGEGADGFVAVRQTNASSAAVELAQAENSDRQAIYVHVADKNGASFQETGKIFAQRIQSDAPSGTPIETVSGVWKKK